MNQKSVDIREKQQENVIYSSVMPLNLLAFFSCMSCLQAVNVDTPTGRLRTANLLRRTLSHTADWSCLNTRVAAPVTTQPKPPQRLIFQLTPKQEEEGGVVRIL